MSTIEKALARFEKSKNSDSKKRSETENLKDKNSSSLNKRSSKKTCSLRNESLENGKYLIKGQIGNRLAEEYREIKRPILLNAFGKKASDIENSNLVMITSSLPGEGKSFNAINLALSIANERNTTVLLIDSDVINPTLTKLLLLENKPGLIDILENPSIDLSSVIFKTDIPTLSVIPAGHIHEHSTELLASDQMQKITTELSNRYSDRIIIFDAPPFLLTSEAKVIAGYMGQILLVVEAGKTSQKAIKESTEKFNKNNVIGIILNKSSRQKKYYGGYGGYHVG